MDYFLRYTLHCYSISAIVFVLFYSKNVGCLCGVQSSHVYQSYDIFVFHCEFILTAQRLSKNECLGVLRPCKILERSISKKTFAAQLGHAII